MGRMGASLTIDNKITNKYSINFSLTIRLIKNIRRQKCPHSFGCSQLVQNWAGGEDESQTEREQDTVNKEKPQLEKDGLGVCYTKWQMAAFD